MQIRFTHMTLFWRLNNQQFEKFGMNDLQVIYKKTADKFIKPLSFFNKSYGIKKKEALAEEEEEAETEEADEPEKQDDWNQEIKSETGDFDLLDLKSEENKTKRGEQIKDKHKSNLVNPQTKKEVSFELENFEEQFEYDDEEFQEKWSEMSAE